MLLVALDEATSQGVIVRVIPAMVCLMGCLLYGTGCCSQGTTQDTVLLSNADMHPCDIALCRKVRRKRNATLFFIEAAVQSVNLVFYILPNIYLLKEPCYFFGRVVFWCGWGRWTCWNTVSVTV